METLKNRASAILRINDRSRYTVPAGHLYPHQWAWDSAFIALGWASIDMGRAVLELETLMAGQWSDGRVPHIQFHQAGHYFPDETFWETHRLAGSTRCPVKSSSITQPPVWATAARRLLERGADETRIKALLPAMDRSHRFFHEQRDPLSRDLVAVVHPWESGLDNSPAWDVPLQAIDPSQAPAFRRIDKDVVGDASQRPTDDQYRRYAVLVKAIAGDDYGPGLWAVYDPLTTAILARAEVDLGWLGDRLGVPTDAAQRGERLTSALMRHLWDEHLGRFTFYDVVGRRTLSPDVIAAYAPLSLDLPPACRARLEAGLQARFWTEWPLPSTAPSDPAFDARRYWRGPTWINMNWLLVPRLGATLRDKTLELMDRHGFWEYFDPHTGEGLGAHDFAWSAALALDLLA
ncbi:MAG TPA: hypothetical protein VGO93_21780 [Candidatus Xenobia bacterium]|jgi:glycogen debranching enzyme